MVICFVFFFFVRIRRRPRSTQSRSSAASDVYKRQLIGGVFVIGLYFWLLFSVIVIAKKCKKTFAAMLVCGLGILIVSQAMIHILVNVGLLPVTGQTLPMISSGAVSYTHLRAHETPEHLVCRLLLEKKKKKKKTTKIRVKRE